MSGHKILTPRTGNPPAKVKDAGIINMVMAGRAAYNAKSGELLLLPEGADELRRVTDAVASSLRDGGFQRVDCRASDEAVFSLAERYVREWRGDATAFCEERGREIRILSWNEDEASALASCETAMKSALGALNAEPGARFAFVEDAPADDARTFVLACPCEQGDEGARASFICGSCGDVKFPDSPLSFIPPQPGAEEREEAAVDVETPGANTIAELCGQLDIDVTRTLKAMLYVAHRPGESPRVVASFVRGDYNLSMIKLSKWLEREMGLTGLRTAEKSELIRMVGEVAGYCGPVGLPPEVTVVADLSVIGSRNAVAGANRPGYHKKGCCHPRDFDPPIADIAQTAPGTPCRCGGVYESRSARSAGKIEIADLRKDKTGNLKTLSYRDREGAHEYPWLCAGSISCERAIIALGSAGAAV
jgi:prolyl-tRNA synthetase